MSKRIIIVFVFTVIFLGRMQAQEKIDVNFETSEDKILIHYFLHGNPDKEYDIRAILRKSDEPSFKLIPDETSGDIGKGKFAGRNCTIVWLVNKSEENMLSGENFYFEVTASEIKESSSWYWYVLGAAALGGGAATYILLKKDKEDSPAAVAVDNVASPPGRP